MQEEFFKTLKTQEKTVTEIETERETGKSELATCLWVWADMLALCGQLL